MTVEGGIVSARIPVRPSGPNIPGDKYLRLLNREFTPPSAPSVRMGADAMTDGHGTGGNMSEVGPYAA